MDEKIVAVKGAEPIKESIRRYPDFPKPGILFSDIFSILKDPKLFDLLRNLLVKTAQEFEVLPNVVVGVDSRGFLFGPLIALELQIPFVPIRKKGKLPGELISVSYALEYGEDVLEMQTDSIRKGENVLLVDDLLGTGGTLGCACQVVKALGGNMVGCLVIIEKLKLKGKDKLLCPVKSLIQYH